MKDHRSKARKRLARCVDAIDEEYIEFLAPLLIRVVVVVQRFFAAPRHAAIQIRPDRQLRSSDWCTPGMGVILSGESPVYETGSLKEVSIPNDRSD